jgi:hypothetical protein
VPAKRNANSRAARSARDREIIALRAHGLTLREIGERFALTRQRVAQVLDRAGTHPPDDLAAAHPASETQRTTDRSGDADQRPRQPSLTPDSRQRRAAVVGRRTHVRRLATEGLPPAQIAARLHCPLTTTYADLAWIRAADVQHPPHQ